ncbi:MAG: DUF433 domain-containing protein [Bacteroidota bacterium]
MVNYTDYIEVNKEIMLGKPVIKGSRLTVEMILEELAAGTSVSDLVEAHPHLTLEAVYAALSFAADALKVNRTYPLAV